MDADLIASIETSTPKGARQKGQTVDAASLAVPESQCCPAAADRSALPTAARGALTSRKRKPGGQPRNLNAARNGSNIRRLTIGELPDEMAHAQRMVRSYRRTLEEAVVAKHGEVNLTHAHIIDECVGHELHASYCRYLLLHRFAELSTKDIVACSANLANARTARNRALQALKLDGERDIFALYYANREEHIAPPALPPAATAADTTDAPIAPPAGTEVAQ